MSMIHWLPFVFCSSAVAGGSGWLAARQRRSPYRRKPGSRESKRRNEQTRFEGQRDHVHHSDRRGRRSDAAIATSAIVCPTSPASLFYYSRFCNGNICYLLPLSQPILPQSMEHIRYQIMVIRVYMYTFRCNIL